MRLKILAALLALAVLIPPIHCALALEFERPEYPSTIGRTLFNSTQGPGAVVGLGVDICDYIQQPVPGVGMNVSIVGNTRVGINYNMTSFALTEQSRWLAEEGSYNYTNEITFQPSDCDDNGTWVPLPTSPDEQPNGTWFKFYGAEYKNVIDAESIQHDCVWVTTNGFLSFDISEPTDRYCHCIPNVSRPNAIIAPLWTDLVADEQSVLSARIPYDYEHKKNIVLLWKGFFHKTDVQKRNRLTFSVGIEGYRVSEEGLTSIPQSTVYFAYHNVSSVNDCFTCGIEDHEGIKGVGRFCADGSELLSLNNTVIEFPPLQGLDRFYVRHLKLAFQDENSAKTSFQFYDDEFYGNNLKSTDHNQTQSPMGFVRSLAGAASGTCGLASCMFEAGTFTALWPLTVVLLAWNLYDIYQTLQFNKTQEQGWEFYHGSDYSSVRVQTDRYDIVDGSLSMMLIWKFNQDSYSEHHDLTVTATLEYVDQYENLYTVTTNLNVKSGPETPNNSFEEATLINRGFYGGNRMLWTGFQAANDFADYYNISLKKGYNFTALIEPMPPDLNYNLSLYSPYDRQHPANASDSHGPFPVSISYRPDVDGLWSIAVTLESGHGFYNMTVNVNVIGDVNCDDWTDIFDAILLAGRYGAKEGTSRWNSSVNLEHTPDTDGKQVIDILDAITLANAFGVFYGDTPPPRGGSSGGTLGGGMMPLGTLETIPSITIDPSQSTRFKGETFTVGVRLDNVVDLAGWEFKLYWNSTVLNCTSTAIQTPTEWQDNAQNYKQALEPGYNATHGRFWAAQAANYPAPSFNGSMTIATLTFQALQPGITSLTLEDTKLGNSTAQPISCTVSSGSVTVYYGRYMRSDTKTVNGLNAYLLNATRTATSTSVGGAEIGRGVKFGIRVWKRGSGGTETEISLDGGTGTPAAVVTRSSGSGLQSATTSVSQKNLSSTDSIVVRVYAKGVAGSTWNQIAQFTTEQLGATSLLAKTWTVYYYTWASYNKLDDYTAWTFYWGSSSRDSRIQNLQYS